MKTNIKVIGIMVIMLVMLVIGNASAASNYTFNRTLIMGFESSTPIQTSDSYVSIYTSSVDHDVVYVKLVEENGISYDYIKLNVGVWQTFNGFMTASNVTVTLQNKPSVLLNDYKGTLRY